MRPLNKRVGLRGTTLASALSALPFPPIRGADVEDEWNSTTIIPEFDLELSSDGTSALTNAELVGASAESQVISDDDVDTVDFANNELDLTAHAYETGDGPLRLTTSGTLPTGLAPLTNYWAIKQNSGTIQLATSRKNALAGTAVAFSDVGAGTHTISDVVDSTERLNWKSHGLLGQAGDGAISLTAEKGYTQRVRHRSRVVAYSVESTISAGNITVVLYPAQNQ